MPSPEFLVYCAGDGDFVLSVKGRPETWAFKAIENAVTAARQKKKGAPLVVYNTAGEIVLETVT